MSSILPIPPRRPRLIAPRRPGHRYEAMDHGDVFYIRTNSGGARDFRIVVAPRAAPEEANWRSFVPHQDGRLIEQATLFKTFLVVLAREDGAPRLFVHELASGGAHAIAFEAQTYHLTLETVYEFDTTVFRFSFASMACSQEIYDYDVTLRQRMLRKKQMTPKDFDASAYVTRSVLARADDGESVPISLLYRRDVALDGTAPLLIYGYGAYGHVDRRGLLDQSPVAGRSRLRLRHRPCARRHREGLALVRGRQARRQAQHVHRLHRRDAPSRRRGLRVGQRRHRAWRQRGGHADGRDRQHGAGALRRRSSPTCPSSMCSTPCSTAACR